MTKNYEIAYDIAKTAAKEFPIWMPVKPENSAHAITSAGALIWALADLDKDRFKTEIEKTNKNNYRQPIGKRFMDGKQYTSNSLCYARLKI